MKHYAIVFKKAFEPGDHWRHDAPEDDSDRKQHWKVGDLYSSTAVKPDKLPFHLEYVECDAPPVPGEVWDREQRRYVVPEENKPIIRDQIAHHEAELARLNALL